MLASFPVNPGRVGVWVIEPGMLAHAILCASLRCVREPTIVLFVYLDGKLLRAGGAARPRRRRNAAPASRRQPPGASKPARPYLIYSVDVFGVVDASLKLEAGSMQQDAIGRDDRPGGGVGRRDFLVLATGAVGTAGAAAAIWPFIAQMAPGAATMALATIEVDLDGIPEGMAVSVTWRGRPVFLRHRTSAEIEQARAEDASGLPDPEPDAERVQRPGWLIVIGVCTHLGCIPLGNKPTEPRGAYGGWFCACHGSHYDVAGRIRKGPAPRNLDLPPYAFIDDKTIRIG